MRRLRRVRVRIKTRHLLLAWIVLFTVAMAYSVHQNRTLAEQSRTLAQQSRTLADQNHALIVANQRRDAERQASRVASCRQTYEGIRQVFQPFFPPAPRTASQQHDIDKFNQTIDTRKARCGQQTGQ